MTIEAAFPKYGASRLYDYRRFNHPTIWRDEYLNTPEVVFFLKNEQATSVISRKVTSMTRTILWDNSSLRKGIKEVEVIGLTDVFAHYGGTLALSIAMRLQVISSEALLRHRLLAEGNIQWRVCHTHMIVSGQSQAGRESHYKWLSKHRALNK